MAKEDYRPLMMKLAQETLVSQQELPAQKSKRLEQLFDNVNRIVRARGAKKRLDLPQPHPGDYWLEFRGIHSMSADASGNDAISLGIEHRGWLHQNRLHGPMVYIRIDSRYVPIPNTNADEASFNQHFLLEHVDDGYRLLYMNSRLDFWQDVRRFPNAGEYRALAEKIYEVVGSRHGGPDTG